MMPVALFFAGIVFLFCNSVLLSSLSPSVFFTLLGGMGVLLLLSLSGLNGWVYRLVLHRIAGRDLSGLKLADVYDRLFWRLLCRSLLLLFVVLLFCFLLSSVGGLCFLRTGTFAVQQAVPEYGSVWVLLSVWNLIVIALLVPVEQCFPTVMLDEGGFVQKLWKGYVRGWRKWGKVFALAVLVYLIIWLTSALLFSPAIVFALMQRDASLSLLQGDEAGLPAFFSWLTMIVLFISSYFMFVLRCLDITSQAYLYASIKVDEEEEEKNRIPMI